MQLRLWLAGFGIILSSWACTTAAEDEDGGADASTNLDARPGQDAEPGADRSAPADATLAPDATPAPDASASPDATPSPDAEPGPDAQEPDAGGGPLEAVLDTRCVYHERIGLVTISNWGGPSRYVQVELYDRPFPWLGPPALSDASCVHHLAYAGECACGAEQVCDHDGLCVAPPIPAPSVSLGLSDGNESQGLSGDGSGSLSGEVTPTGDTLTLSLSAGALEINVPPASIPDPLVNPSGTLTGSYETPEAVDLAWQVPANAAHVYSHTNINHHVSSPTFTTCVVPASAQSLHIDGDMLVPLAVVTGLEFQAIEHVRFASANTPSGCVEFRFSRAEFVNLSN